MSKGFSIFEITSLRAVQPEKALSILLTDFPISTDVKPVQFWKAAFPIFVTEFGIVTEVKLVQPENVIYSMLVTEFGIVIELKFVQL